MTFEQFQATRQRVADLSAAAFLATDEPLPGLIYAGGCHIFDDARGGYELYLLGEGFASRNLQELERRLYKFYINEVVVYDV